jgi:tRNA(Ile)-lysidine synthase
MNINTYRTLPAKFTVACSGGVDSVVLAHLAVKHKREVTLAFFNHGTGEYEDQCQQLVQQLASSYNIPVIISGCETFDKSCGTSKEMYWRDQRINWFRSLAGLVATGHNLDDQVEWYLHTCFRGRGRVMPYSNFNTFKPLQIVPKKTIRAYAVENSLIWHEDPSNADPAVANRNRIRHSVLPEILKFNPGIYSVVRRLINESHTDE